MSKISHVKLKHKKRWGWGIYGLNRWGILWLKWVGHLWLKWVGNLWLKWVGHLWLKWVRHSWQIDGAFMAQMGQLLFLGDMLKNCWSSGEYSFRSSHDHGFRSLWTPDLWPTTERAGPLPAYWEAVEFGILREDIYSSVKTPLMLVVPILTMQNSQKTCFIAFWPIDTEGLQIPYDDPIPHMYECKTELAVLSQQSRSPTRPATKCCYCYLI